MTRLTSVDINRKHQTKSIISIHYLLRAHKSKTMYCTFVFCASFLVVCSCVQHEVKPASAQTFCGDDFIRAWQFMCRVKLLRRSRVPRTAGK